MTITRKLFLASVLGFVLGVTIAIVDYQIQLECETGPACFDLLVMR